jgi:putative hydrolase of the HAD superfamily
MSLSHCAPAVLLDAMGTLVALEPPVPALRENMRERFGLNVTEEDAARAMRAEIAYYRAHHGGARNAERLADLRRHCAEVVRAELPGAAGLSVTKVQEALLASLRFSAYPDAPPALRELREGGACLVVVSNWDVALPDALGDAGLLDLVDGVVTSAGAGAAKPAPRIFERALALAEVEAGDALHVGDSMREDVGGARRAGIRPLLLVREGEPPSGVEAIRSLAEIAPYSQEK